MAAVGDAAAPGAWTSRRSVWLARVESPLAPYYLILGATLTLTFVGLLMVLSSSSVEAYDGGNGSSYAIFSKQASFAALGLPLAWLASRLPTRFWSRWAWPMLAVALVAQGLVFTGLGRGEGGNRNWLSIGGQTVQPSELCKVALIVWGATVLARKRPLLDRSAHLFVPVVPVALAVLGLVMLGRDLGTAMILLAIVGALLFVAGVPLRAFALATAVAVPVVFALVSSSGNRTDRLQVWLSGTECADLYSDCWQPIHGRWALATGGWWGVGLGSSREKWQWLPAAHNDYIFSIIGEELGLLGTLSILGLFGLLALGLYRLVVSTQDLMVKIATAGVFSWVLVQALVNIAVVVGLLPVIGLPLPLVSSGGSALMTTLFALGMVLGFARRVPGASEALAARAGVVRRSLAVIPLRVRRGG